MEYNHIMNKSDQSNGTNELRKYHIQPNRDESNVKPRTKSRLTQAVVSIDKTSKIRLEEDQQ
jgi:hypothetical protein